MDQLKLKNNNQKSNARKQALYNNQNRKTEEMDE